MKYKIVLFSFLFLFTTFISAQTVETTSHQLSWNGIEKWIADSASVNVISFSGAQYLYENRLPYFNKRIICDQAFSYQVEIKNTVYTPLIGEEKALLDGNNAITSDLQIYTNVLHERGTSYLDIRVLPFVNQQGEIVKILSFDLVIHKSLQPKKVATATQHTYATSSVLAQGKFVKIKIENTGVYKLTYEDLLSMGITPANVRVFGYGGNVLDQSFLLSKNDDLPEVAIWMEKGADGVFNSGDYILFYAQGINKWTFNKAKSIFTHTINPYSKYGYYFVTSDAGVGKKIVSESISLSSNITIVPVEEFNDYQVHENDLVNIISSGKEFYGEKFSDVTTLNIPFTFPNAILTNTTTARLDVAAVSQAVSNFTLSLNSSQNKVLSVPAKGTDNYEKAKGATGTYLFTPQTDTYNFSLAYVKSSSSSIGYLNYLEVNARRQLKMAGSMMPFRNVDYLGTSTYCRFQLSEANNNVQIWDITDPANINSMQTEKVDGKLTFVAPGNQVTQYLAIDPTVSSSFPKPEIQGVVQNQNLHALAPVDMIILTHPNFLSQAKTLAKAHREKDNLTVEVVTTDQVYNEFSSGTPDATAYRWVMKMLYDRAESSNNLADIPKYLLLFGKGTFDNRKILIDSGDNFILTYETENSLVVTSSYVTDDYFTFLDDNEGADVPSNLMDIGVGRFSVSTAQQATDIVNKTIGYIDNTDKGNWKNQLCFLADDGDGSLHASQADIVAESVEQNHPAFQINKIFLDAYKQEISASGESYPLAKSRLQNLLRSGLFMLNYTGHGSPNGWTNESVLALSDVKSLSNQHLPIWVAPTCDFNLFDIQSVSAGEQVVLNPVGGGIGIFSAARPVYSSQNFVLNKLFCDNLFKKQNGEQMRVGDVIVYAKNHINSEINKLSYIYLGDPAIKLNYPTKYTVITTKVNESTSFGNDTLHALAVATIQGIIADDNGSKITDFNGTLHVIVYDKGQQITTLNNDGDGPLTYSDRQNTLFSGDAAVINGAYSFSFMLPKDIKYNYGSGRLNYYAKDEINDYEAQGYFENFIIGGTNTTNINDTDGPDVQLYLNSTNFISGDNVNETPLFMANLSDINGINTVGSGIGHDLTLTIDQDPFQSLVINDYFQAKVNSYSEGFVKYKLPEMKNGKHSLTFRAWDLLNNSTTKTINFEVVKGLAPEIFTIYNYPNPAKTNTIIVVNHDRPETILNTTIEIFDILGRKVWSKSQLNADNIAWDLITDSGRKAKTGIYLYRVSIKTTNSDAFSKTNKMLVLE